MGRNTVIIQLETVMNLERGEGEGPGKVKGWWWWQWQLYQARGTRQVLGAVWEDTWDPRQNSTGSKFLVFPGTDSL